LKSSGRLSKNMLTQILPMNEIIPYGKQHITQADIDAVSRALQGDYLTQGPLIAEFESAFAAYVGAKYAVAVANGTAALHLSALSLNVKEGDKVITTPITFAASANCIRYCGGEVVFSDIDPNTYLIDLDKLEELLSRYPVGTFKGIIPVDFAGLPVDMERLKAITSKYGMWIIEDACHAPGGYFVDSFGVSQSCGNGKYADLAIFSFHPVKHIATGEGGMITTNDYDLYQKLLKLRTHGITRSASLFTNTKQIAIGDPNATIQEYPGWYMEMQELGYNYRLTDIQAALGLSQLKHADQGLQRRIEIASYYNKVFKDFTQYFHNHSGLKQGHAYHLYIINVRVKRLELYNYLKSNNIYSQVHYIPCHLMPYYRELGYKLGDYPNAESYYRGCLSLPMFPTLTDEQLRNITDLILKFHTNSY
jgi:UDP-4-amino-4,6-dideoxy-N-acetyl-beta-L-altrosamine transaminase